jgi:rare lipoprotein A
MKLFYNILIISLLCGFSKPILAEEFGNVAYYSDAFHGRPTANGELYDVDKLTGAHKAFPYGTMVKVTRLDNNRSVTVRINDRGPYVKGHIIDVSRKAAKILGIVGLSDIRVKIQAQENQVVDDNKEAEFPTPVVTTDKGEEPKKQKKEKKKPKVVKNKPEPVIPKAPVPDKAPLPKFIVPDGQLVDSKNYKPFDLYKIQLLRPDRAGYGLQVASMSNYDSMLKQVADLQEDFFQNISISIEKENGKTIYKVILGPFPDLATAESYKVHAKKKKLTGFVVSLKTLAKS